MDRLEQFLRVGRLLQKRDGAGFHRSRATLFRVMRSQKDDRDRDSPARKRVLQLLPVHPRHVPIEDDAADFIESLMTQEFIGRSKQSYGQSDRSQQTVECFTN